MKKVDFVLPEGFCIEEVRDFSDIEDKNVEEAGDVKTWKPIEFTLEEKVRFCIAGVAMSLWIACIIAGLIRYMVAGDLSLLICSPVLVIVPLREVVKYYFRR